MINLFNKKNINKTDVILEVPINECVHYLGYKYGGVEYNPYQTYLVESLQEGKLEMAKRHFIEFLRCFRPSTFNEAFGIGLKKQYPLFVFPWDNHDFKNLKYERVNWKSEIDEVPDILSHYCEKGIPGFRIDQEFYWLERALNSIKEEGYHPEKNTYIKGRQMVNKSGEKAYLLLDGNHRISALYALGHKNVRIRINPKVTVSHEIEKWPGVKEKYIDKEDALKIFQIYFSGNSVTKTTDKQAKIIRYSNDNLYN